MTVTNTDSESPIYVGNGSTVNFSTVFHFQEKSEVLVYKILISSGVATLQTLTTHYTLVGQGTGAAGTVTFLSAPTSLYYVKIVRLTPLTQTTDYVNATKFPAETHEAALDKLTRLMQELDRNADRAPQLPLSSINYPAEFPDWGPGTANHILSVNDDGTALELVELLDVGQIVDLSTPEEARDLLGLGTTDTPEFSEVNIGHASDTTLARSSAGNLSIEGNVIYRAGGTDVPLSDGGTGASLTDPNADRLMFWDDSASSMAFLALGTGLTITGTTINAVYKVVQHVYTEVDTSGSGSTQIPFDDTIPQNTEGNEVVTLTITPTSASNLLVIEVLIGMLDSSGAANVVGALFQDATANAVQVVNNKITANGDYTFVTLKHIMAAGTTSDTTFKFRLGPVQAVTLYWNRTSAAERFSTSNQTVMSITEIAV